MRGLVLVLLLAGCRQVLGIPGEGELAGDNVMKFPVNVMARGAKNASAEVRLDVALSNGTSDQLVIGSDGPQAISIADGLGYTITTAAPCTITGGSGMVDGAPPAGVVAVTCDGLAALADPGFSAPLGIMFTPRGTAFDAVSSLLVQQTTVTPRAIEPDSTLEFTLDGAPQTGAFALSVNQVVEVVVHNSTFERHYRFTIQDALPTQFGFGKPAAPSASSQFGVAVAADGNAVAVGAPGPSNHTAPGHVYVFRRAGTTWTQEADLTALVPTFTDEFGASVALANNTLVVGAPGGSAAYVFTYNATTKQWQPPAAKISVAGATELGRAVAVDDTYFYVGAPGEASNAGTVRRYARADVTGNAPTLLAHTAAAGDRFGAAIASRVSIVVVGAPGESTGYAGSGAAYIFDAGTQVATLKAPTPGPDERFGSAVATDGTLVVIGAPLEAYGKGAAYSYKNLTGWQRVSTFAAPNADLGDNFGASLSVLGDVLVIGAPFEDSGKPDSMTDETATDAGAAFAYELAGGIPTATPPRYVKAQAPGESDAFGFGLALALEGLVVGTPYDDSAATGWNGNQGDGAVDTGAVHAFR
jgi:hypothetical protein